MISLNGVVVNLPNTERMLKETGIRVADLRRVFRTRIAPSVAELFGRVFATKGAILAGRGVKWVPWQPISPMTRRGRSRPGHGRMGPDAILQDTRRLWASLAKLNGPEAVTVIEPLAFSRGTSVPYARWASGGFISRTVFGRLRKKGPKRVVPRPLSTDSPPAQYLNRWEKDIADFIGDGGGRF